MILLDLLRYFALNGKLKLAQAMQYKADFLIGVLLTLTFSAVTPLFAYLFFSQTRGYPRWTVPQILLLQGVVLLWTGIRDLLFGEVRGYVEGMVRGGSFDRLLLKPYPPIGIILASGFYTHGAGTLFAGLAVVTVVCPLLGVTLHSWYVPLFLALLLCGIVLHMALTVLYCTVVVLVTYMGRLGEILDKLLIVFQYPLDVLPPGLRLALSVFLPIALWAFFPTEALLGRLPPVAFAAVGSSLALLLTSLLLWSAALRRYTSAGG